MEHSVGQLQQASVTAVEALQEIIQDPKASVSARVMAARTVLEMALRATQADNYGRRLSALEHDAEKNALRFPNIENDHDEPSQAA